MKWAGVGAVLLVLALCLVCLIAAATADEGGKVMVTRPGVVFHLAGSSDLRGHGVEKSLSEALSQGYTPCRICFASHTATGTSASVPKSGAAAAAFGAASGAVGVSATTTAAETYGPSSGYRAPTPVEKGGTWNPYLDPRTILFPGIEQKGY